MFISVSVLMMRLHLISLAAVKYELCYFISIRPRREGFTRQLSIRMLESHQCLILKAMLDNAFTMNCCCVQKRNAIFAFS